MNTLDSGDGLNPRRNDEFGHWTRLPLTCRAIASSVALFGHNPWAARLSVALSYLLCVWFAWRLGRISHPARKPPRRWQQRSACCTLIDVDGSGCATAAPR